jgi:hypothetical protein
MRLVPLQLKLCVAPPTFTENKSISVFEPIDCVSEPSDPFLNPPAAKDDQRNSEKR